MNASHTPLRSGPFALGTVAGIGAALIVASFSAWSSFSTLTSAAAAVSATRPQVESLASSPPVAAAHRPAPAASVSAAAHASGELATPQHTAEVPTARAHAQAPERTPASLLPHDAPHASEMRVAEAVMAHDVHDRMPVEAAAHFAVGERVWAWIQVENRLAASEVDVVWSHEGVERSSVRLQVGVSRRWRTWARRTMRPGDAGDWSVEVRTLTGEVLHTLHLRVDPVAANAA